MVTWPKMRDCVSDRYPENRARASNGQREIVAAVGFQGEGAEMAQQGLTGAGSVEFLDGQRHGDFHVEFCEVLASLGYQKLRGR